MQITILSAQTREIRGRTVDEQNIFLPFVHFTVNHGQLDGTSSITGEFSYNSINSADTLTFYSYTHDSLEIVVNDTIQDLKISLKRSELFEFETKTDLPSSKIIQEVINHKDQNAPRTQAPFYYETYNKLVVTTNKIHKTVNLFNRLLNSFKVHIKDLPSEHHIILSESTTERKYLNELNEEENVTASKITGIDKPGLLTVNSQIQLFSIYDEYLPIVSTQYVNPINKNTFKRYHFILKDRFLKDEDSVFVIQFNPVKTARFESLKGFLYINSSSWAIEKAILLPARNHKFELEVFHSCEKLPSGHFFPKETFTKFHMSELGKDRIDVTVKVKSRINKVTTDTFFFKSQFDEYAFRNTNRTNENPEYWEKHRTIPFTQKDSSTYIFYDSLGTLKQFERALNLGERLYFKEVPYKKINIQLNNLFKVNGYEYLRLGLGLRTNDKFHNKIELGGHLGFDINYLEPKYGAFSKLYLNPSKRSYVTLNFNDDFIESGATNYFNDNNQYSTEWIRDLSVKIMDREIKGGVHFSHFFQRYFLVDLEFNRSRYIPQYSYVYENSDSEFDFTTFKLGLKISYGERYFKILNERVSFGTKYPKIWLQYTKGLDVAGGDFNYWQIDAKIEHTLRVLDFGKFAYQINIGSKSLGLPYPVLYSSKSGSAALSHNSFETMEWNEFTSNKRLDIFLSHDFGYFNYLNMDNFRPKLELAFNMGISKLSNYSEHDFKNESIKAQDYSKGYYEAGFILNNLLQINYSGVKLALGAGYYMRMGYYAHDSFLDNSKIKVALQIKL